jgi:hypothetical protein
MTRRTLLGCSAAVGALASFFPSKTFAEISGSAASAEKSDGGRLSASANLYAFPGLQPGTTVIGASWPDCSNRSDSDFQSESQVTIHTGAQEWQVTLPGGTDSGLFETNGVRVFAGSVAANSRKAAAVFKAVVIEIPETTLSSTPTDIWAERVTKTGLRQRVGSPFVAALLAEDPSLAHLYHRISPSEDRKMLTGYVVNAIEAEARKSGATSNSYPRARRLASLLLPDVLHYNPQMPAGFTFAAQNGRHPEEISDLVVDTVLSGCAASHPARADFRLQELFPFFPPIQVSA